jgi:hypothetical protein
MSGWDPVQRTSSRLAIESVGLDVGGPVVEIDGVPSTGPLLSSIALGDEALTLFGAVRTLGSQPGSMRIERPRHGDLRPT